MAKINREKEKMLSHDYLREILYYNKPSGLFVNKVNRGGAKKSQIAGGLHNPTGYIHIQINGKKYRAHRLAVFYVTGEWPLEEVDHLNHEPSDNRWCNLRCVTNQENGMNRKMDRRNKSGITGVCFREDQNRWEAQINIDGKTIHLYRGKDKHMAILARKQAEIDFGFDKNHGLSTKEQRHLANVLG